VRHYTAVALGLGTVVAGVYYFILHDPADIIHAAREYFGFIALIGSLFVVAGGIQIQVKTEASPLANTLFLLIGALAANVLGTAGAAMLLIRPWLQMNRASPGGHHIVFFIFIIANVGGCLTPIGDPPLYLGFLEGIPFWWTLQQAWPIWATAIGLLLALFYVLDCVHFSNIKKISRLEKKLGVPNPDWKFAGGANLFFLAVILGSVFVNHPPFLRETLMVAAAAGSYFTTPKSRHAANGFNFHPINEVAILFAGIFATMIPALGWLDRHAAALLGHDPSPGVIYWSTGTLSMALDNAPTFLGFLSVLRGESGVGEMSQLLTQLPAQVLAISLGAVFFGAATYLGNGPNFMVKAVAEHFGVRPPSFLEFILKYSLPCLLPVLAIVWWLFFRG
jgi:Na+/H+ antiporter NhaD/arsenite permease-like protein